MNCQHWLYARQEIHLRWTDDGYGKCSFSKEKYY